MNTPDIDKIRKGLGIKKTSLPKKTISDASVLKDGLIDLNALRDKIRKSK